MRYFLDCEFHEGFHKPIFDRDRHFIDLISIGIVAEDGREYYTISKDFDIKAAWNSYQMEQVSGDMRNRYPEGVRKYWLRENVLYPIYEELLNREYSWESYPEIQNEIKRGVYISKYGSFKEFCSLLRKHGKSNKEITEEIKAFVAYTEQPDLHPADFSSQVSKNTGILFNDIEFYGYYADYDWVLFCSLFGKMIDLPKGFPIYCIDLKQTMDEKAKLIPVGFNTEMGLKSMKLSPDYPKQINEHNALADAKWNYDLYKFLKSI